MEGGVENGIEHANCNFLAKSKSPLLLFRSTPPFSAINKFLEVAHGNNPSKIHHQPKKPKTIMASTANTATTTTTTMEDIDDFSLSSSTNTLTRVINSDDVISSPIDDTTMHENNHFFDGSYLDENESQNSEISHEVPPRNEEINSLPSHIKKSSKGRKPKGFTDTIKGQWTEEEDRLLKTLVMKYGERKWALIARSYLVGRAGKQCRERWHNHLRPDIKKDAWDEEEERMLVSAHQQFGNKWAEIARRIPGRSENSIKNHWNATRRRQNSRRRNKNKVDYDDNNQSDGTLIQSSILQEYIKMRYPCNDQTLLLLAHQSPNPNPNPATSTTTLDSALSPSSGSTDISGNPLTQPDHLHLEPSYSNDQYYFESPTSMTILANPCHEEVVFMQQLFRENHNNDDNNNNNNNINNYVPNNNCYNYYYEDEIVNSMFMNSLSFDHNNHVHYNSHNSYDDNNSDNILANLLDGESSYIDQQRGSSSLMINYDEPYDQKGGMMTEIDNQGYNNSSKKKDMDLLEMILAPHFTQSSSNFSYY